MILQHLIAKENIADTLVLSVPYRVKGKARPRFDPRSNRAYMPKAYCMQINDIQWLLRQAMFSKLDFYSVDANYAVEIKLMRRRRKPKSKKEAFIFDSLVPLGSFAPGKPDWDNAAGTMADAGNGILYGDDDQIVLGLVYRTYGDIDGAEVTVMRLKDKTFPKET